MKTKEILRAINDNIADYYLRFDIGFSFYSTMNGVFLIPTIEIVKLNKFLSINIWILSAYLSITINRGNFKNDSDL